MRFKTSMFTNSNSASGIFMYVTNSNPHFFICK